MAISNFPILSMLRTRMHWHQERQRLLAENVSNADTPNFRPRDLPPPKLEAKGATGVAAVSLARTSPSHLGVATADATSFQLDRKVGYETRPAGNAVKLEDEMMKVAANQMDYQAATALYSRSLGLIKTALGRR
jgi:flagellar basal-body rod protein FlgB